MEAGERTPMSDQRADEAVRRNLARQHRGEVVEGSGEPIEGRSVPQMVSVRLDPALLAELRALARKRGSTVSDLLREGAGLVTAREFAVDARFRVSVIRVTGQRSDQTWLPNATARSAVALPEAV
jgi:hypothetical protein